MPEEIADIAVVGAGAAGLMTAIAAGRVAQNSKSRIFIFDTRKKIGAKILISGGTRCNVTHVRVLPSDYEGGPKHFVKHVLEAFSPNETIRFFEQIGVMLVLEPTGKYFPTTHSGKTILEALLKETERLSVILKTGIRIETIEQRNGLFYLTSSSDRSVEKFTSKRIVLTTGGLSYPETGSDGTGYKIAKSFGHSLVETSPALTPLLTHDSDWPLLSGVVLEAKLSYFESGRKVKEIKGPILFTHFGFSGPAALDISRYFARADKKNKPVIESSFLPQETEESLNRQFKTAQQQSSNKFLKNFLMDVLGLPARFVEIFLKKISFDEKEPLGRLREARMRKLSHLLLNFPLPVTEVFGYKKAEVTAGGIDLREIHFSTMESKLVAGLYFAGEILDVDGRIGGFNFQWAWSTGTIAGRSAAKSLL